MILAKISISLVEVTYKAFFKICDIMYLTEIDRIDNEADTFFPKFNVEEWDREVIADF